MRRIFVLVLCLVGLLAPDPSHAQIQARRVLILWDSTMTARWRDTFAHLMLEMPLNRLGTKELCPGSKALDAINDEYR